MKLNAIIAIEKGVKSRVFSMLSQVYKTLQKPELFNGHSRTYRPLADDGEQFPDESKRVQYQVKDLFEQIREGMTEYLNIAAQRDIGNCSAKANVKVGDKTLLEDVPVTYLLMLEKQLNDLKDEIDKAPTLSPDDSWAYDTNIGCFKGQSSQTAKSKKIAKPMVLYPHTDKHPAQVKEGYEDQLVGNWTVTALSGAMPVDQKREMVKRMNELIKAVKIAREEANEDPAPEGVQIGEKIFGYVFGT